MNAGNVGEQYGRTRDEIRQAAMGIRIRDAIGVYRNKAGLPTEFSYSLETGKHYDADNAEDRTALLERYSDGHSPVYMIAVTNAVGTINDEIAVLAAIEACITASSHFLEGGFLMMLSMRTFLWPWIMG